ncbi:MAG: transporter substrate-binding domain-containing protein [Tissierellia bacterium]|nr:transporter substrate-binding domain-containing protein [Tissierellia bacterium]
MKKILSVFLMFLMILTLMTGCGNNNTTDNSNKDTENNEKIKMVTNAEFPPFEYFEGENIVGVDVEIAKEIAKDLGKELEVEHIDFSSVVPSVQTGKADFAAAGITITPERLEEVDFSIPYVESIQHVIYIKGQEINSLDELKGKKIGVQLGTTGDISIADNINLEDGGLYNSGAEVVQYKSPLEAAQDLIAGRIDVVVIDKLPAEEIVKNNGDKIESKILGDISESYGIAVKKGDKELLESINKTLERLISEGKIEEYIANHSE